MADNGISIDALTLNVGTSAGTAADSVNSLVDALKKLKGKYGSVNALAGSITRLKEATAGGLRLSGATNQIQRFGETVARSINQSRIGKLNDLAKAMTKLKRASSDFKMPSMNALNSMTRVPKTIKDASYASMSPGQRYMAEHADFYAKSYYNNPSNTKNSTSDAVDGVKEATEAEKEYAKKIEEICEANRKAGKTYQDAGSSAKTSASEVKKATLEETNAIASSVSELQRLRGELQLTQREFNKLYNNGGWTKAAIKKSREISDLRDKIYEIENPPEKIEPIDIPDNMYDALEQKSFGLSEAAERYAEAGDKLKTASSVISGIKTDNKMFKVEAAYEAKDAMGWASYKDMLAATEEQLLELAVKDAEVKAQIAYESGDITEMKSAAAGYHRAAEALDEYRRKQAEAAAEAKRSASVLRTFATAIREGHSALRQYIKEHTKLLQQFGRVAKMRAMRAIIRSITQGFKEGIGNLYQYSKAMGGSFAKSMDDAASAMLTMKNSIATAVAPLIQYLIPVLQEVVGWVREACNWLAQFFATLNGQTTYTRAKDAVTEWGEAASDSTKGAKNNLKEMLASFDELNVIASESNSGSGSGKTTANVKDYFEDVPITDETAISWGNGLKKIIDDLGGVENAALLVGGAIAGWKLLFKPIIKHLIHSRQLAKEVAKAVKEATDNSNTPEAKPEQNTTQQEVKQEAKQAQQEVKEAKQEQAKIQEEIKEAKQEQAKIQNEASQAKLEQAKAQHEAKLTESNAPKLTEPVSSPLDSTIYLPANVSGIPALTSGNTVNLPGVEQLKLPSGATVDLGDGISVSDYVPESAVQAQQPFWSGIKDKFTRFINDESGAIDVDSLKTAGSSFKNWFNKTALDALSNGNAFNFTNGQFVADAFWNKTATGSTAKTVVEKAVDAILGTESAKGVRAGTVAANTNSDSWFWDTFMGTGLAGGGIPGLKALPGLGSWMIANGVVKKATGIDATAMMVDVIEDVITEGVDVLGRNGGGNPVNLAYQRQKYGFDPSKAKAYTDAENASGPTSYIEDMYNAFKKANPDLFDDAAEKVTNLQKAADSLNFTDAGRKIVDFVKKAKSLPETLRQNKLKAQTTEINKQLDSLGVSFKGMADTISNTKIMAPVIDTFGFEGSIQFIHDTAVLFGDETADVIENWEFVAPYVDSDNYGVTLSNIYRMAKTTGTDTATVMQNWKFIAPTIEKYGYDKSMNGIKTLAAQTGTNTEYIVSHWEYLAPAINQSGFAASASALGAFANNSGIDIRKIISAWEFIAPYIDASNPYESAAEIAKLIADSGDNWQEELKKIPLPTNPIYVPESDVSGQVKEQAQEGQEEAKKHKIFLPTSVEHISPSDLTNVLNAVQKKLNNSPLKAVIKVAANASEAISTVKNAYSSIFSNKSSGFSATANLATSGEVSNVNRNVTDTGKSIKQHMTDTGLDILDSLKDSAATSYETKWNANGTVDIAPCLASGAFDIPSGQMFIAREAGPELVGRIGSHTTVANNDQIVRGIEGGVASANEEQNRLLREQNALLRALYEKESTVKLTPSAALGRVNAQSAAMYGQLTGR